MWELAHWHYYRKPTIAMILEYTYDLIKVQARRPERTYRTLRYLYEASPMLDELPRVFCAYVRTPFLLSTKQIVHYLTAVEDDDLRTALALAASGYAMFHRFDRLVVGDFDVKRGSFVDKGLIAPDWVRLYLVEHYNRCKEQNRTDTDPFFYNFETLQPYNTYELVGAMRHYDRRTGMSLYRHSYIAPYFPAVPENAIVRYF